MCKPGYNETVKATDVQVGINADGTACSHYKEMKIQPMKIMHLLELIFLHLHFIWHFWQ